MNKLSPQLNQLNDLPLTAREQRQQAAFRSAKMSVQGIQAKLSVRLSVKNQAFEIVDSEGTYILKPQSDVYRQLPENEDLTMKMAASLGIEVPISGLVYAKDGSLTYFVKRFDRYARNKKYALEDFAQLTQNTRATKYNGSMEQLIPVIEAYCTFPLLEKRKLFRRVLFCFLTGNEDMHLKNFSLITRRNKNELSPAYDLVNSTISMDQVTEEIALPLAGKKRKLSRDILVDYYGKNKLRLSQKSILAEMELLKVKKRVLEEWIRKSFLSDEMKERYTQLLFERYKRLDI